MPTIQLTTTHYTTESSLLVTDLCPSPLSKSLLELIAQVLIATGSLLVVTEPTVFC